MSEVENKVLTLGKYLAYVNDTNIKLVEPKVIKDKKTGVPKETEVFVGWFSYFSSLTKYTQDEKLMKILSKFDRKTKTLMKEDFPITVGDWVIESSDQLYAKRYGMRVNKETGEEYRTEVETCYYPKPSKEVAIRAVLNKIELRCKG